MSELKGAVLADRGVVRVTGEEAGTFLQGLVTADVAALQEDEARLAALLTPQGKILFDFLMLRAADGFWLDCRTEAAADLARRLGFYRLRTKVEVADASGEMALIAWWGGSPDKALPLAFTDPRLPALGSRAFVAASDADAALASAGAATADLAAYHAHRVALGVPEAGLDFTYGETFPHEADMDLLGGVSFDKGCYVGQEVVSRMQHRGSARTRIVPVRFTQGVAGTGAEIIAGGKVIGKLGSVAGEEALAMMRLDRAGEALAAGGAIMAGSARLVPRATGWADFDLAGAPRGGDE